MGFRLVERSADVDGCRLLLVLLLHHQSQLQGRSHARGHEKGEQQQEVIPLQPGKIIFFKTKMGQIA